MHLTTKSTGHDKMSNRTHQGEERAGLLEPSVVHTCVVHAAARVALCRTCCCVCVSLSYRLLTRGTHCCAVLESWVHAAVPSSVPSVCTLSHLVYVVVQDDTCIAV